MVTKVQRNYTESVSVGTVESVTSVEIIIALNHDSPNSTAINSEYPVPFPKINNFLIIPNETGALIGMISELFIKNAPFPKRKGYEEFGIMDLPFPEKKLKLAPVGTIERTRSGFNFVRGVKSYPTIGDPVYIPLSSQIDAILKCDRVGGRIKIGTSVSLSDKEVVVNPDKLFGRHLAVLGNTGSGKSCTVAGLIKWSIEAAEKRIKELKDTKEKDPTSEVVEKWNDIDSPNARFIVIDPNGEYKKVFKGLSEGVKIFTLTPNQTGEDNFNIPYWMWNFEEWVSFTRAAPGTQRPTLKKALALAKAGTEDISDQMFFEFHIGNYHDFFNNKRGTSIADLPTNQRKNLGDQISALHNYIDTNKDQYNQSNENLYKDVQAECSQIINEARGDGWWNNLDPSHIKDVYDKLKLLVKKLGRSSNISEVAVAADYPIRFQLKDLIEKIDQVAIIGHQNMQNLEPLKLRIRSLLDDSRLKNIVTETQIELEDWLDKTIDGSESPSPAITVIDVSQISSDLIHLIVSVLSRMIFEAIQRCRRSKENRECLETVLVIEEAHNFIARNIRRTQDDILTSEELCRSVFEKIAKEGRKFGLGLVVSSQRPSELSETVLSQCNTFLIHRIVNDNDQEYIKRLVPDNLRGILNEMPNLATRQAFLMGWASEIPLLVEINHLEKDHQPESEDPHFWDVWTGKEKREIDWEPIVRDWKGDRPTVSDTSDQDITEQDGDNNELS